MNIGIDFNTKTTKAAILVSKSNINDYDIFETNNILVFFMETYLLAMKVLIDI